MCGIKVPQRDFALKMLGGLMHEGGGGGICGTLRYFQCEARYSEQVQGFAESLQHSLNSKSKKRIAFFIWKSMSALLGL